MARRRLGIGLIVAGGMQLSYAGGQYAIGAVRADRARQAWEASSARESVARARSFAVYRDHGEGPIVNGAPVTHLVIPRIGLDEIVLEGVDGDDLNAEPGHVPGSAMPGERGNSVISAHRDRHFNHLDDLFVGDSIITESGSRRSVWVVVSRRVIDKNAPALFRTRDATLTLTTCWPVRYLGPAPQRLIITAKVLAAPAPLAAARGPI